jgi:hypothetical protein
MKFGEVSAQLLQAGLPARFNTPSSGFATFSPTKSVGEKALD